MLFIECVVIDVGTGDNTGYFSTVFDSFIKLFF